MTISAIRKVPSSSDTTVMVLGDDQELVEDLVESLTREGYAVLGMPPAYGEKLLRYIELSDFIVWTDAPPHQLEATLRQLPPSHRGVQCIGLRNRAVSAMTSPGVMSMFLIASLMRAGIHCPQELYLSHHFAD